METLRNGGSKLLGHEHPVSWSNVPGVLEKSHPFAVAEGLREDQSYCWPKVTLSSLAVLPREGTHRMSFVKNNDGSVLRIKLPSLAAYCLRF